MYTFTISRAVERGHVDASYKANATRGYQGVLQKASIGSDGHTNISDICIGTNVDDVVSFYFNRPRATNDFHGLGAFLIMNEQLTRTGTAGFLPGPGAQAPAGSPSSPQATSSGAK